MQLKNIVTMIFISMACYSQPSFGMSYTKKPVVRKIEFVEQTNPLWIAYEKKEYDQIKELILKDHDANTRAVSEEYEKNTLLHAELENQSPNIDFITFLINHDADVNALNQNGLSPLQHYLMNNFKKSYLNDSNIVTLLLNSGADLKKTSLHILDYRDTANNNSIFKELLLHGADPHEVNGNNMTPYNRAINNNNDTICKHILCFQVFRSYTNPVLAITNKEFPNQDVQIFAFKYFLNTVAIETLRELYTSYPKEKSKLKELMLQTQCFNKETEEYIKKVPLREENEFKKIICSYYNDKKIKNATQGKNAWHFILLQDKSLKTLYQQKLCDIVINV